LSISTSMTPTEKPISWHGNNTIKIFCVPSHSLKLNLSTVLLPSPPQKKTLI
jgi:hypothetical protein